MHSRIRPSVTACSHCVHLQRLKPCKPPTFPWRTGGQMQKLAASSLAALLAVGTLPAPMNAAENPGSRASETATPIKHLVVIFNENISFDHYFATYPKATNPAGEPAFHARPGTPAINGLTEGLKTNNP